MKIFVVKATILSVLLLTGIHGFGQKVFDFNATCQQAYNEITKLKLNSGQKLIDKARLENPNNLIPDLLSSYIDFFILFFNEDPAQLKVRQPHFSAYLEKMEDGPKTSPFYNYCRSAVYIQKACVEIKFGQRWSSGWDFRRAFSLIKENRKSFPQFVPNDMIYGPMQVVAGTIPDGYKWLAGLFGIKGSIKNGLALMQSVLSSNDAYAKLFYNEAVFYYCYVEFYIQNQPGIVFDFIKNKKLDVVNNHLLAYMATNLALNDKRNDYALSIITGRNPSTEYMQTPVWDFELGYVKMRHLELDAATKAFENFTKTFKGKFYLKDAYEKLSWCCYLSGKQDAANNARKAIISKGSAETDADKQALKDAKTNKWPVPVLLKARLLNDGGYNNEALAQLSGKSSKDFAQPEDQLEFTYRLARIYDDLGKDDLAIKNYTAAIFLGETRTEYFAARAALQTGMIYEKQGKKNDAVTWYQKCISMQNHDYKDSIDQKAKAGIARCKGQ